MASGALALARCGAHATNTALEAFADQSARGYCKQHQQNVARHPRPEKAGSDFLSPVLIPALRTHDPRSRTARAALSTVPQIRPVASVSAKFPSCHPLPWPSSRTIRRFAPTLAPQITPVGRQKWPGASVPGFP